MVIYRVGSKKDGFNGSVPISRDLLSRKTKQVVMQLQDKVLRAGPGLATGNPGSMLGTFRIYKGSKRPNALPNCIDHPKAQGPEHALHTGIPNATRWTPSSA